MEAAKNALERITRCSKLKGQKSSTDRQTQQQMQRKTACTGTVEIVKKFEEAMMMILTIADAS